VLTDVWPLFGLVLGTPRLELRSPSPEQPAALAELADDGTQLEVVRGQRRTELRFRLARQTWAARQTVPVEIEGLEPCWGLLGAVSRVAAPVPGS
jgi:hypothetical protein